MVDLVHKFIMVDVTCTDDNDVITEIVGCVEVSDSISSDVLNIVSVSLLGLSHHMFSVNVEMGVFDEGFKVSMVVVFVFL